MVLSHRAKFQLIINFFRVSMYFVVFLPNYLFSVHKFWIRTMDKAFILLLKQLIRIRLKSSNGAVLVKTGFRVFILLNKITTSNKSDLFFLK